jgi:hypothetical protein
MYATTVMAVVMLIWCGITLAIRGPANSVPFMPDLKPKVEYAETKAPDRVTGVEKLMWLRDSKTKQLLPETLKDEHGKVVKDADGRPLAKPRMNEATGKQEDPLGWIGHLFPGFAKQLRTPGNWLSIIGVIGLLIAFGHSILAMSGEETLA